MSKTFEVTNRPVHETLATQPREFNIDDVCAVQAYLLSVKDGPNRAEGLKVPTEKELYSEFIGLSNINEEERYADEGAYDAAISKLLTMWAKNREIMPKQPETLAEAIEVHRKFPQLDEFSPVSFDGKAGSSTIEYVHIDCGKALGVGRDDSELRYYLNPSSEYIGEVVDRIITRSLDEGVPLYFKFVNLSSGYPDMHTLYRGERIVIYASHKQSNFINGLIETLREEKPEAFSGRHTSGFGEEIGDGISRGDEVTANQSERFQGLKGSISFNKLRSKLIFVATMEVTKSLISSSLQLHQNVGGKSVSQIFSDNLKKAFEFNGENDSVPSSPEIEEALAQSFSTSEDENTHFSNYIDEVELAIKLTAVELLPFLAPEELLERYKKVIRSKAPEFGIDPNNLAYNLSE